MMYIPHTPFTMPEEVVNQWGEAIMQSSPWRENNMPRYSDLEDLHLWLAPLIEQEIEFREHGIPIKELKVT